MHIGLPPAFETTIDTAFAPSKARQKVLPSPTYQRDPIRWMVEAMGIPERTLRWSLSPEYLNHTWDGTVDPFVVAMQGLADSKNVGIEAGTGTNKTYTSALICLWFLEQFVNCTVVTTAPKEGQLTLHLWKEVSRFWAAFSRRNPNAQMDKLRIRMTPGTDLWAMHGFVAGVAADEVEQSATKAQGFHCMSEEHQILTRRGWLGIDELAVTDQALSPTLNGDVSSWVPVSAVHKYRHTGPLHVYDGRWVSFAVTGEHRFPTKYAENLPLWKLKPLDSLASKFMVRRIAGWEGEDFKVPAPFRALGFTPSRFAEFIGFWIGDGGLRFDAKRGKFYDVVLYQSKPDGGYVERLLGDLKFYHKPAKGAYYFYDQDIAQWLLTHVGRYGVNRRIPTFLKDATPAILNCLVEGLWRAEGSHRNGRRGGFYNTSPGLMDDVQEVLIKLGRPSTISINTPKGKDCRSHLGEFKAKHTCYVTSWVHRNRDHIVQRKNIRTEHHDGRVWCITTPTGMFYTRRNGKVCLSGNSEHMLIIHEEMPGTAPAIIRAFENTCTAPHNIRLGQGNPDHQDDPLHRFCLSHDVVHVRVSALDHPNVVCQNPSIVPGAVSQASITRRIMDSPDGENDRMVLSRVRGISPSEASDALIKWEWCVAASEMPRPDFAEMLKFPGAKGVDVAQSESGDKAAIATMRGPHLTQVRDFVCRNATQLGRDVVSECDKENIDLSCVGVDGIGIGAATVNAIRETVAGYAVKNIQSAGKPIIRRQRAEGGEWASDVNRFANARSQMCWQMREDLQHKRITLPKDPSLFRELTSMRYSEPGNKVLIETKDQIKKRIGGYSPNKAEAVIYANWVRPRPGEDSEPEGPIDQNRHPGFDRYGRRKIRGASDSPTEFQVPECGVPSLSLDEYEPVGSPW